MEALKFLQHARGDWAYTKGLIYYYGDNYGEVPRDHAKAMHLFQMAEALGNQDSQALLGAHLLFLLRVKKPMIHQNILLARMSQFGYSSQGIQLHHMAPDATGEHPFAPGAFNFVIFICVGGVEIFPLSGDMFGHEIADTGLTIDGWLKL